MKYFIDENLIPNDGSYDIIKSFEQEWKKKDVEIVLYPDLHHKKGSKVVNGMLTSSNNMIIPAMLGVENCGFTFGKIDNMFIQDRILLEKSFELYSHKLKDYDSQKKYSIDSLRQELLRRITRLFQDKKMKIFDYLSITSLEKLNEIFEQNFTSDFLKLASRSLGTLGGGNHFFELYSIEEIYDESFGMKTGNVIFILHSDSIEIGDRINLLFSNLSELNYLTGMKRLITVVRKRIRQFMYFAFGNSLLFSQWKDIKNLILNEDAYRMIYAESKLGKSLIFMFFLAAVFGEMNREIILNQYADLLSTMNKKYKLIPFGSHSHDSINVESVNGKLRIVQRNGVQFLGDSPLFALPGALGTASYIFKNNKNKNAFYSANHGVGRLIDKHIAREKFSGIDMNEVIKQRGVKLYRVGKGNISEQHPDSFKNVESIVEVMEKNHLGCKVAKLRPITSLKG